MLEDGFLEWWGINNNGPRGWIVSEARRFGILGKRDFDQWEMKHYQAMGVVMHKLLRIIYGILKNKAAFSAETDEKNQQKSVEKQQQNEQRLTEGNKISKQKKHRFQDTTTEAPISRRAEQKIKKQIASQTSE